MKKQLIGLHLHYSVSIYQDTEPKATRKKGKVFAESSTNKTRKVTPRVRLLKWNESTVRECHLTNRKLRGTTLRDHNISLYRPSSVIFPFWFFTTLSVFITTCKDHELEKINNCSKPPESSILKTKLLKQTGKLEAKCVWRIIQVNPN